MALIQVDLIHKIQLDWQFSLFFSWHHHCTASHTHDKSPAKWVELVIKLDAFVHSSRFILVSLCPRKESPDDSAYICNISLNFITTLDNANNHFTWFIPFHVLSISFHFSFWLDTYLLLLLAAKLCDSHADLFPFRIKNKKKRRETNETPDRRRIIRATMLTYVFRLFVLISCLFFVVDVCCCCCRRLYIRFLHDFVPTSFLFFLLTHSFNVGCP